MHFFVTATDTNAGKTHISCLLIRSFFQFEIPIKVFKPVCSGGDEDVERLVAEFPIHLQSSDLNLYSFTKPATPSLAAGLEGKTLDPKILLQWCNAKMRANESTFFEGVGGWLVPLWQDWCVADWVAALQIPVLLVVPDRLGCLNHTLLTVKDIERRNIALGGILLNTLDPAMSLNDSNQRILQEDFGLPVLGKVPFGAESLPEDVWRNFIEKFGFAAFVN